MPRNDRSDSLSVRSDDDPRNPLKAPQQEAERELRQQEAGQTGGPAHQSRDDRDGVPAERRPEEERTAEVRRATDEQDHDVTPPGSARRAAPQ